MKETGKDPLLKILTAEGLLDEEQVKLIKSRETQQRSKILKAKTTGARHTVIDQSFISLH